MRCRVVEDEGCGIGIAAGGEGDCSGVGDSFGSYVSVSVISVRVTPHSLA